MIWFLVFGGLLAYVFIYYHHVRKYPKGPLPLPLIGNLYHLSPDSVHEYLHKIGMDYGHCVTLFLPRPVVFFTDYHTVYESLVTKGENFTGRSQLPPELYLQRTPQTGVVISDGLVWTQQRRTAMRILRDLGMGKNLMEAQVNRGIDEMLRQLKETNDGVTPIDMFMPIQMCTGNVMNETLFGYHFEYEKAEKFECCLHAATRLMENMKDNFWVFLIQAWPWARHLPIIGRKGYTEPMDNNSKACKPRIFLLCNYYLQFHDYIENEVSEIAKCFNKNQEPTNFVEAYLVELERNEQLDMANLCGIIVDLWIAGVETTSATLKWALLLLMENPHVQEKMRAELFSVVGNERRIEMADKQSLPYFNAAVTEILRCANILPFTMFHRCTEETLIGGMKIPKDALTLPQIYSVMLDDEVFESPGEFRPERFLGEDKVVLKKMMEQIVPFGLGKRQCIGEGLARMELFLVLGTLLLNYRFDSTAPIDMTPLFGSILTPRPYKCLVIPI